jgi:hypothetical protein
MHLTVKQGQPSVFARTDANITASFMIEHQPGLWVGLWQINLNKWISIGINGKTLGLDEEGTTND